MADDSVVHALERGVEWVGDGPLANGSDEDLGDVVDEEVLSEPEDAVQVHLLVGLLHVELVVVDVVHHEPVQRITSLLILSVQIRRYILGTKT